MIFISIDKSKYIKKIVGIVEPRLTSFLRVLGIDEIYEVKSLEDFENHISAIYRRNDVAIIITQRSLIKQFSKAIELSKAYPILLALPDKEDLTEKAIDIYKDIIRKFIGYEIFIGV